LPVSGGCCYKIDFEIIALDVPAVSHFTDVAVPLRVMVGVVVIVSGWNHLKDPMARSKDIAMSKGFNIFLGAAEVAASLGVFLAFSRNSLRRV